MKRSFQPTGRGVLSLAVGLGGDAEQRSYVAEEDTGELIEFLFVRDARRLRALMHRDFHESPTGAVGASSELPPEAFLHVMQLSGEVVGDCFAAKNVGTAGLMHGDAEDRLGGRRLFGVSSAALERVCSGGVTTNPRSMTTTNR